jgi:hypothetical protein
MSLESFGRAASAAFAGVSLSAALWASPGDRAAAKESAMETQADRGEAGVVECCRILELRQYTLKRGARETLIALFDERFVEEQERHGMTIVGQFRDAVRPERFVWIRGFRDMEARREALEAFYSGAHWRQHSSAANATMIAVDDVLLLKPLAMGTGFRHDARLRPKDVDPARAGGQVVVTIHHLGRQPAGDERASLAGDVAAAFGEAGARLEAQLLTERAPNTYPRLPIREDANVLVWVASYPSQAAHERSTVARRALPVWRDRVAPRVEALSGGRAPVQLLLQPTSRSALRDRSPTGR